MFAHMNDSLYIIASYIFFWLTFAVFQWWSCSFAILQLYFYWCSLSVSHVSGICLTFQLFSMHACMERVFLVRWFFHLMVNYLWNLCGHHWLYAYINDSVKELVLTFVCLYYKFLWIFDNFTLTRYLEVTNQQFAKHLLHQRILFTEYTENWILDDLCFMLAQLVYVNSVIMLIPVDSGIW